MSLANAYEQLILETLNAERAKVGSQPLSFNGKLNDAAEDHSAWMDQTDTLTHTGAGGSSPYDRMIDAGYVFSGNAIYYGENIAGMGLRPPSGYLNEIDLVHSFFMGSPGHRANILNNNFKEVGIGFTVGFYISYDSIYVTQDFAQTASNPFLTGVAFDDHDNDSRYDINEGLGNFTVTALDNTTGSIFTTQTGPAGGYSLELASGNYTVSFSASGYSTWSQPVSISNRNVKLDLIDPATGSGTPGPTPNPDSGGEVDNTLQTLVQNGDYDGADAVLAGLSAQEINSLTSETLSVLLNAGIRLMTGSGDYLYNAGSYYSVHALGGNDTIQGGSNDSRLFGGSGSDRLYDYRGGNDYLQGGSGNDHLDAGDNNDTLYGGDGADTLIGGAGTDKFIFRQGDMGVDRVYMSVAEGDKLDVSDLLSGFDPSTDSIHDFIQLTSGGFSTHVFVDTDGQGSGNAAEIALLYGTSGVSIEDVIELSSGSGTPGPTPNPDNGGDIDNTLQTLVQNADYEGADAVLSSLSAQEIGSLTSETLSALLNADIRLMTESSDYLYNAGSYHSVHALGGNDTILGGSSHSRLFGGSGNDGLYDYRGGNDYLHGGAGIDYLDAGDGNDTLYGGDGSDTLIGGAGVDTFIFRQGDNGIDKIYLNIAGGDKLDVSDLLSDYNPAQNSVSDFVQLESDGFSTSVFVDADGNGVGNATEIAVLVGVTGLNSADALEASGNLITA